jgi:3,4-dihydroxy 2-butanone 4-phosphate synthase/GTP cyclohydrolase II
MESIIKEFSKGKPVIIMDDLERENEGDIVFPAEFITSEHITDILHHSSGIICVTMTEERATKLGLTKMCSINEDPNGTNFTVSCDHTTTTTGVSSEDRAKTIRELVFSENKKDFTRPGHVFPLVCKNGLLMERKGHTEASVQLCMLSGLNPVAVICELMNPDGTMMRLKDCKQLSSTFNIPLITVKDIEEYSKKINFKSSLESRLEYSECDLRIKWFALPFKFRVYKDPFTNEEISVLYRDKFNSKTILRLHSECLTGNVFHSLHCDCNEQLQKAIEFAYYKGGMVLYVGNHEGRGIGLFNKVKAYKLQAEGEDTVTANTKLGFEEDCRDYSFCIRVLREMGIKDIKLLTNNQSKVDSLTPYFNVERLGIPSTKTSLNERYLTTKIEKMSHSEDLIGKKVNTSFDIYKEEVRGKSIAVVYTIWNEKWVSEMVRKIHSKLEEYDIKIILRQVPGAYELPFACKKISMDTRVDAIIAVGVVLKGETVHFEYICDSVYKGLMDVQLAIKSTLFQDIPIINGVLTCLTEKQAEDRVNSSLPEDWALSALHMIQEYN